MLQESMPRKIPSSEEQVEIMLQLLNDTVFTYLFIPLMAFFRGCPTCVKRCFRANTSLCIPAFRVCGTSYLLAYPLLITRPDLLQSTFVLYRRVYAISVIITYKHLSGKSWIWAFFLYISYAKNTGMFLFIILYGTFLAVGTYWKIAQSVAV